MQLTSRLWAVLLFLTKGQNCDSLLSAQPVDSR